jgi:hypothetical protein
MRSYECGKTYYRKISGISTISTTCGQTSSTVLSNLSTAYPHFVDKPFIHNHLLRVKTSI